MDSHPSQSSEFPTIPASNPRKPGIGRKGWIVLGAGAVVASLLGVGILPRLNQQTELQSALKAQNAIPSVNVITPSRAPATTKLVLPGSVVTLNQTTVYARSTGYLQRWLVDIGDRVRVGQLLAVIESPELDQQVAQAKAQLTQAQANLAQYRANLAKGRSDLQLAIANEVLAAKTWQRSKFLVAQGVVSRQDADTQLASYQANFANVQSAQNTVNVAQANVAAAVANVNASQANLRNYQVLQSFEQVTAPFSGVITARNVNLGVLVTAGSSNTNTSLYTIAADNNLLVNVNVPQPLVQSLQLGQSAQVQVRELPQRVFTGKISRTTNALDPTSRTLLTQLSVPNPDGLIRPGMYATVSLNINRSQPPLMVLDSTLVINSGGTQVATVTKDQTVHYQLVQLGRDDGTKAEIISGLSGNESLINNPTTDLVEGTRVKAVAVSHS